jgi:anti-anti-sigma factor
MSVAFREVGCVVIVKPDRVVYEGGECDAMEARLLELVRRGASIVIDLSGIRALSAHCIGVLANAQHYAMKSGGRIALCGVNRLQRRLLAAMGLVEVLPQYESAADAVRRLSSAA